MATASRVVCALVTILLALLLWAAVVRGQERGRSMHIECSGQFPIGSATCLEQTRRIRLSGNWDGVELCNGDATVCRGISNLLK